MDALPYYKWFWIDYRANRKVQRMSWQARGLYRELLDEFWSEGILPLDLSALAEICGCPLSDFEKFWPEILPCWEETAEGLVNLRMNEQRTEKDLHRVKMAKAGQSGAFAKLKLANASKSQKPTPELDSKGLVAFASKSHIAGALAEQEQEQRAKPEAIAKQVQSSTGILTEKSLKVFSDVIGREQQFGIPDPLIVSEMTKAWADYQSAIPHLDAFPCGPEKFFGEGKWKSPETWGWAKGQAPRKKQTDTLSMIRARNAAAAAEVAHD